MSLGDPGAVIQGGGQCTRPSRRSQDRGHYRPWWPRA